MKTQNIDIGVITVGENIHVSDPCYSIDCWCAGKLENMLPGEYNCSLVLCNDPYFEPEILGTVRSMTIRHSKYKSVPRELTELHIGVDSGQAGFYNIEYYAKHHKVSDDEHCDRKWYQQVCELTRSRVNNSKFMQREDYMKQRLGSRYIEHYELRLAEKTGEMDKSELAALKEDYWGAWTEYEMNPDLSERYITIGYGGILDNLCFVASSGQGDGGYHCYVAKNKAGNIVAAQLRFI